MTVYVDAVFALNAALDYLLLAGGARLAGAAGRRARLALAAILGGIYAALSFWPPLRWLSAMPARLGMLGAMVLLAYGTGRRALAQGGLFLLLSLALCGLVLGLSALLGAQIWLLDGRAYYAVGFGTLVLTAGALYCAGALVLRGAAARAGAEIVPVTLRLGQRQVQAALLRDTGNTLRDPFSGRPVLVLGWRTAAQLLPPGLRSRAASLAAEPVQAVEELARAAPELQTRLIPYRAVGQSRGLLLAIRCDAVQEKHGAVRRGVLAAISPTELSDGGAYDGLIGGEDL